MTKAPLLVATMLVFLFDFCHHFDHPKALSEATPSKADFDRALSELKVTLESKSGLLGMKNFKVTYFLQIRVGRIK